MILRVSRTAGWAFPLTTWRLWCASNPWQGDLWASWLWRTYTATQPFKKTQVLWIKHCKSTWLDTHLLCWECRQKQNVFNPKKKSVAGGFLSCLRHKEEVGGAKNFRAENKNKANFGFFLEENFKTLFSLRASWTVWKKKTQKNEIQENDPGDSLQL